MKVGKKKLFQRIVAVVCAAVMMVSGMVFAEPMQVKAEGTATMWLVGDSTVCSFTDAYYYPRYGYGTQIENYLDGSYTVQNLAMSGRSSKSFLLEDNYTTLKNGIKAGDVLIIGFGHNDEKAEEERYTNPNGDYKTEGSFAKSLYDNYVKVAQDAGAEVILCTPIVRRTTGETFSNSQLHITSTTGEFEGGDYAKAIKDLGAEVNVPVVDLTTLTKDLYLSLGASETLYLHAWTGNKETSVDDTHLNIYGAKLVAYMLAEGIQSTDTAVASHIVLGTKPTKENDLKSNPDYVAPTYSNELTDSSIWKDYDIFKGTVFGDVGGASKISTDYFALGEDANGAMRIAALDGKGKITTSSDGIAMYYYKVPVGSTFTFSAKATINSIETVKNTNQVSFGLMARDDMYIDKNDKAILSDYVAAGSFADGVNCFYRNATKLNRGPALTTETIAAGKSYDLKIESNSDGYACTFGSEPTQTGGFDFQLTSVDSEYVYVGMFVSRKADVSFSDIKLVVDGETVYDTTNGEGSGSGEGGSGETGTPGGETGTPDLESIKGFVGRFYSLILNRVPSEEEQQGWINALANKESSGVDAGFGFVFSPEGVGRNFSNEEFVEILYNTFMGRPSDEGGKNAWVEQLNAGVDREKVFEGFVYSQEFAGICAEYGIEVGDVDNVEALKSVIGMFRNQNPDITKFVSRCYAEILGREADPDGLEAWCEAIIKGENTPRNVAAEGFLFSGEFREKNMTDAEYIQILYKTFFGREADEKGLADWTAVLAGGEEGRDDIIDGFANSDEFKDVLKQFGLAE